MGLTQLLNTARDGLTAQSFGLNVTGQNVANVNTPGYIRREAQLETRALGTQTSGTVNAKGLRRVTDAFLERRQYESQGLMAAAKEHDQRLESVEALYNDLSGTGFGSALDAVFQSFSRLAANPSDPTVRMSVLQSAEGLSQRIRDTANTLAETRDHLLKDAQAVVTEVNENAEAISQLNRQISISEAQGGDAADLKDQRNNLILDLAGLIDVRTISSANGSIAIQASGITLVEGEQARTLSIDLAPGGALRLQAQREGGPPTEITRFLTGGKLAGIRESRDQDVFEVSRRLDEFVFDVATAINTQHALGFDLDGQPGGDVFDVGATEQGAARAMRVSTDLAGNPNALAASASAAQGPGGSANAAALSALSESPIAFGATRTAAQAYGDLVGDVATRRARTESMFESREAIHAQIEAMHQAISGVSLDEEFVNLTKFQRAYEASARVLAVADELLQELLARVGN